MNAIAPLWAEQSTHHYYRLARLAQLDEWWHWLALGAVLGLIVLYVAWMYRRDGVELSRSKTILLAVLRLCAFVGILVFFLQVERRADRGVIRPSRVAVMVDTSQSMGLSDPVEQGSAALPSRSEQVIAAFNDGKLLAELRKKHEVVVYRFDAGAKPTEIAAFPRAAKASDSRDPESDRMSQYLQTVSEARTLIYIAAGVLGLAIFAGLIHYFTYRPSASRPESWAQLVSMVALIVAVVFVAVANLRSPDVRLAVLLGLAEPSPEDVAKDSRHESEPSEEKKPDPTITWSDELAPRSTGTETRLADALRFIVDKERGGSIAGIVLVTDGGQNSGVDPKVALVEAQDAEIPVYAIGIGSDKLPRDVKVVDLEAPQRVYPGDEFNITAYVQATGLKDFLAEVHLFTGPADASPKELVEDKSQTQSITLGDSSDVQSIVFKLKPAEQGRRQYMVRVTTKVDLDAKDEDDEKDNARQRSATVEVVDRKNKVLLFAGGPTREFRFLRNQLYRDKDTVVDVYLQTGKPEVATEANKLIYEFPKSEDDLFVYDCIVAFDPDWEALDELQVQLLERWVAEKAGGLIVVAGPVHTSTWAGRRRGDKRFDVIKSLYPVSFYTTGSSTLNLGRTGGEAAWPLQFTREGHEAEFLWLGDDTVTSEASWQSFDGVYGYFAVKDPKPGAKVFARFADPETSIDNELPIYMAGHFYGAGRVFFQASGEMWRLRAVDETYFETYYTKLLRWVSQGRLMQDSSRGILLVDKERCLLGEQVVVRAILTDEQRQPLKLPEHPLTLVTPKGDRTPMNLTLVKESPRHGTYSGQFTATTEGDYRLELRMIDAVDELLLRQVRAEIPKREIEHPQRNDALLREITSKTDGDYYIGFDNATSGRLAPPLANTLEPQDQKTIIPGTPDRDFDRRLMTWLMGLIVGVLCVEWLLRRLSKLA